MAVSSDWMAKWEKDRAGGATRYVLRVGVLGFGGAMLAINLFLRPTTNFTVATVLVRALAFALGGFLFGAFVWLMNESKYQK